MRKMKKHTADIPSQNWVISILSLSGPLNDEQCDDKSLVICHTLLLKIAHGNN
jgi:hypothetical protein